MGSAYLQDWIDNAEYQLDVWIPALVKAELDHKQIYTMCLTFGQHGVCSLLLEGNTDNFYLRAMQSAGSYLHYLRGADDAGKVTSHTKGLYDAIGCGYWELAEEIARHSRHTWHTGREYEEDFLFVFFLMKHALLGGTEEELRDIIQAHDQVTEGEDIAHRDMCVSLLEKDSELFDTSLRDLLTARQERVEAMVQREAISEEDWSWLRYYSSEGWALLKLGERAGIETGKDYLHVPESIRGESVFELDANAWQSLSYRPRRR